MNEQEIAETIKIIREPITVHNEMYHYFDQENYDKLQQVYENCQWFINNWEQLEQNCKYLQDQLKEFKEEHKIMKQILIENGLWERLLNDDRFLKYLRVDDDD